MSALVLLTLLGFFAVIVAALLVWTLLSPRPERPEPPPRPARSATNDEVRGAKRPPERERPASEEAFERFLRAGRDDTP